MPSQAVTRTFGWGVGLALVGLPFPEGLLGFHQVLQERFGVGLAVPFALAYLISLAQMMGECYIFDVAGQRMSKRFSAWWAHSWIRHNGESLWTFVVTDLSVLVPIIRPFLIGGLYILLFVMSAHPIPIPIPGNPFGRGGAIALWRSLGIRGGGWVLALGTLVRLGVIAWGINAATAR